METLNLNTLYKIEDGRGDGIVEVVGGTVRMYQWLREPTSSPISDDFNAYNILSNESLNKWQAKPRYVYCVQESGTTTAVILSGVKAEVA